MNLISELDISSCRKRVSISKKHARDLFRKTKVYVSKQELKRLFCRKTSMIRRNHAFIVVTGTIGAFYFQQLRPLGLSLGKMLGVS